MCKKKKTKGLENKEVDTGGTINIFFGIFPGKVSLNPGLRKLLENSSVQLQEDVFLICAENW